ncbi:hypothetical protein CC79DRAFT_1391935 [Sarocladium strictum]
MIHVTDRDMARHYVPHSSMTVVEKVMDLQQTLLINDMNDSTDEQELLHEFQTVASRALPTFGIDPMELGQALVRIAQLDKSNTSRALIKLMMSFAAVNRHGLHAQMMDLKIQALHDLSKSKTEKPEVCYEAAVQHLAAGMLLCSIELHRAACTTGQWLVYLSGVKSVVRASDLHDAKAGSDVAMLLDWMYYFDTLARFSFQHWQGAYTSENKPKAALFDPGVMRAERPLNATPSMGLIEFLGEVTDATAVGLPDAAIQGEKDNHVKYLRILEWRIQKFDVNFPEERTVPQSLEIMQLFKDAMLVYLNRANEDILGRSSRAQNLIDRGFETLARMPYCDRQFPVLILGCEARSEEQRALILDVMKRTEQSLPSRSYDYARIVLTAIWSQDDLSDEPMEYWHRLSRVMGRCTNLPTFV